MSRALQWLVSAKTESRVFGTAAWALVWAVVAAQMGWWPVHPTTITYIYTLVAAAFFLLVAIRAQLRVDHQSPDQAGYDAFEAFREPSPLPRIWIGDKNLNHFATESHQANIKWWQHPESGLPKERNKGELFMLIVSEIAEAMEGERKDLMDDKLPHRKMAEVELADALIRIFDYAAGFGYDLEGAYQEKMAYNATRADHTHAARLAAGGKKF